MDWEQEVAERLKKLDSLRQAESSLEQELERLRSEEAGVQSSLIQLRSQLTALEGAMQVLTPEERLVVERMLVFPLRGNVDRLAELLNIDRSSVYRLRKRAIQKMEVAMFGRMEN